MKICPTCGAQLPDTSNFCPNCGFRFENDSQKGYQQGYQEGYQPGYQQWNGGPARPVSFGQRNIALAIVLSIITLGIYGIIWFVNMVNELNEASENESAPSGGVVFLLTLITCGIYQLYWFYKAGEAMNSAKVRRSLPSDSNAGVIYLVLGFVGLGIVSYALIQNDLNKIAEYHGAPKA